MADNGASAREYIRDNYDSLRSKYETIFRRMFPYLGREDFEEVFHETLMAAVANDHQRRGDVDSWMRGILLNQARDHSSRIFARQPGSFSQIGREGINPDSFRRHEKTPVENVQLIETCSIVRAAVSELGYAYRPTMELYYFKGLSVLEVSEKLGTNPSTVKRRMFYARKKLRSQLTDILCII